MAQTENKITAGGREARSWFPARVLAAILGCTLLGACVVGPDYVPPTVDMPAAWSESLDAGMAPAEQDLAEWWTKLNDQTLNSLVERAQDSNLNLSIAVTRILEARARYGIARSDRYPNLIPNGGYSRRRISENLQGFKTKQDDVFSVGFDSAWEIDVFGRITRSIEAARADVEFNEEDLRDVLVTVNAEVVTTYVMLRSFQARLIVARRNVSVQQESLRIAQARFDAELSPELDVFQAKTNLANTESQIPDLEAGIAFSINRLAVLLGEFPQALKEELSPAAPIPAVPASVAAGAPADLIRRRPDIRAAERQLARQTALIGVATADLYPRFTLNGFFSFDSNHLADWFKGDSVAWSLGPAFQWNLFQGGAIRANIAVEQERTERALIAYQNTILLAVEEVENAITSFNNEDQRYRALQRAAQASGKTVELSTDLYRRGLSNYQNVLDAHRSKLDFDLQQIESQGARIIALARLYRSMGGGWQLAPEQEASSEPAEKKE